MTKKKLAGMKTRMRTGCGTLHVCTFGDKKLEEVVTYMGTEGCCGSAYASANARLITLLLSKGVAVDKIIKQLEGIQCNNPSVEYSGGKKVAISSCADAIATVLKDVKEAT